MTKKEKQFEYTIEKHPFDTFIFPGIKYLIIGTFPTRKTNLRYNFFYSGEKNLFWYIIEKIYNHSFQYNLAIKAVEERKEFLRKKGIGITDMYEMCYRRNNSSTDENLFPIILTDIFSLLDRYVTIERLIFTSRPDVFGALGLFKTYLMQQHQDIPKIIRRPDKILEGEFLFNNRNVKLFVPYSPSPRVILEKRATQAELVEMYKICLK